MKPSWSSGWVRGSFGQHYEVIDPSDQERTFTCVRRGKQHDVACGDRVLFQPLGVGQGVIEAVEPRRTLLWRADHKRHKLLAANVDCVMVVSAGEPTPSFALVSRTLVAAEAAHVAPLLILNKADLTQATEAWLPALQYLESLGYPLIQLCADDASILQDHLRQRHSLMVGQSGMGKTTLLNTLVPGARAATQAISQALDSGCHTTTSTRAYPLAQGGWLMDSPGIQAFGLGYLDARDVIAFFPEFSPLQGLCRFPDCHHDEEPGCALKAFVADHPWRTARLRMLRELETECRAPSPPSKPQRRQQRRQPPPDNEGAP